MAGKNCARVHCICLPCFDDFSKSEQEKVIVTKITGFNLKNCSKSELRQNMGWTGRGGWGGGVKNGITSGRIGYFWPDGSLEGRRPALQAGETRKWPLPTGNRRNRREAEKTGGKRRTAAKAGAGERRREDEGSCSGAHRWIQGTLQEALARDWKDWQDGKWFQTLSIV